MQQGTSLREGQHQQYEAMSFDQLKTLQCHLMYDNMRKEQVIENLHQKIRNLVSTIKRLESSRKIEHFVIPNISLGKRWRLKLPNDDEKNEFSDSEVINRFEPVTYNGNGYDVDFENGINIKDVELPWDEKYDITDSEVINSFDLKEVEEQLDEKYLDNSSKMQETKPLLHGKLVQGSFMTNGFFGVNPHKIYFLQMKSMILKMLLTLSPKR